MGIELGSEPAVDVYLVTIGHKARNWALAHLNDFREKGLACTMDYAGRSIKAQMKDANRENARFSIIIGDNELESGRFTLRDMEQSEEENLSFDDILKRVAPTM